ncbi:hypothetical protein [Psychroserpens algicola]|uniref:Uncharacterized protein n=1 Tax=Psychroserpens algicola TaxID=1719034 RepID=A0ABT0H7S5_9FLAO|nr:hypothetical protein [Psychroserpens algicola]MCK8480413.1 hypothetical protein [Psychroserpens algicola]
METDLFTSEDRKEQSILDGYHLCDHHCNQPIEHNDEVWCLGTKKGQAKNCYCRLFSRDKDAPDQDLDSWRHEAKSMVKTPRDINRVYRCFYVKKIDIYK